MVIVKSGCGLSKKATDYNFSIFICAEDHFWMAVAM